MTTAHELAAEENQGGAAYCCEVCGTNTPTWRLDRRGDAVVTWACNLDLAEVCRRLQRPRERTEVVVRKAILP